jgi:hypothetical protein
MKLLNRRTLLRGAGIAIALPALVDTRVYPQISSADHGLRRYPNATQH